MENKTLWLGVGGLVLSVAALVLAIVKLPVSVFVTGTGVATNQEQRLGGTTGLDSLALKGNLSVDGTSTLTGAVTLGSSNTAVDLWKVATTTVDVASLGSGGATSSAISVSGVSTGDAVSIGLTGSWAAPSSSVQVTGSVTASDVVTIYWLNTSSTAVNLTSANYTIEVLGF